MEILDAIINTKSRDSQKLLVAMARGKQHRATREYLMAETRHLDSYDDATWLERVVALHNRTNGRPMCQICGKQATSFNRITRTYRPTCGTATCQGAWSADKISAGNKKSYEDRGADRLAKRRETTLSRYGVENVAQHPDIRQKMADTLFAATGSSAPLGSQDAQEKYRKTVTDRFGVEYPTQATEVKEKVRLTCLEKFGGSPLTLPENRVKAYEAKLQKGKFHSAVSQEFCWELYRRLPDTLQRTAYFAELNKEFIIVTPYGVQLMYAYDFVVSGCRKAIEFQGDFFHANPHAHRPEQPIINGLTANAIWQKDRLKREQIERRGFRLGYVWESEFRNDREVAIESALEFVLGE